MQGLRICAIAAALAMIGTSAAHADDDPPDDAQTRAEAHWRQAEIHYDLAEWDDAIDELRAAYKLLQHPSFLFNIAQAYRLKGDCKQALTFYETYERSTEESERRKDLPKLLAETRACAAKGGDAPAGKDSKRPAMSSEISPLLTPEVEAPADPATSSTPASTNAGRPDDRRRSPSRVVPLVTGGAGLALVATGLVFHLRSRSASSDIAELGRDGGVFDDSYVALEKRGRRDGRIAAGLYAAGAAAVATGVVLYLISPRAGGKGQLALTPRAHGGMVSWFGSF